MLEDVHGIILLSECGSEVFAAIIIDHGEVGRRALDLG